jgi:P22 coat protein - gene protein 5
MANALTKDLEIMFEDFIEGYDAACVISREAQTSYPDPTSMQRAGDVFYKPMDYMATVTTGLDISGATPTDVIQRQVPTVYRSPDNVLFALDAKELRDPQHKKRMGESAANRLSAEIDKNLYSQVAARAAIFVKKVGANSIDEAFTARALMSSRGINAADKKIFYNPFDAIPIYKELATKSTMGDWSKAAYERAIMPSVGTFKTFETDNQATIAAIGTVSGTTINGNQSHTVTAMTGDVPTDNRQMVLNVAGANIANIKAGDTFTIANVNAVHNIEKSDTGQLMTFRVLSVAGGGANLTVSPALVSSGPYQNVTAQAANGAALTFLNTVTKPVNAFWAQGAVALDYGRLAFPSGQGAEVMTATTKQGVPLIMSYNFNHLTGKVTCRFTTLYAATVLNPEQCGVILANQT